MSSPKQNSALLSKIYEYLLKKCCEKLDLENYCKACCIFLSLLTLLVLLYFMQYLSFITGNKPPGMVPNKFMYMTNDLHRLAGYFNVPLQFPADPFEAMFKKGTYKQDLTGSVM